MSFGDVALRSARQCNSALVDSEWQSRLDISLQWLRENVYRWSLVPWKGLRDTVLLVPGLRTESPQLVSLA